MNQLTRYFLILLCVLFHHQNVKSDTIQSFHLSQVKLLESPFYKAQQADLKYILEMDADRLLAPYLKDAGIEPLKDNYPNWENTGLDGHIGGHYLSALSLMYASTGNQELLERLNYMIQWLDTCQQQNGNGYVGGIPNSGGLWDDISDGQIDARPFSLNDYWVPLYNIHKLFAGLRDAYIYANHGQAFTILVNLTDWFYDITKTLSEAEVQEILQTEHGGLNEVFVDVYDLTGEEKYLEMGRRFSHKTILDPILNGNDELTGLHANTQIPKVIGFQRYAVAAGDTNWHKASKYFWNTVIDNRTVSIGGNSVQEHFHPPGNFTSMVESVEGPETCNTYNMLRLTKQLYLSDPDNKYIDYYERALYNHILSSVHPEKGGFVYFTPMRPRHYRVFSQVHQSFWCCVGSGIENHGKYGEMIYTHNNNNLYVNLFIPSELDWDEQNLKLIQQTAFPDEERTTLELQLDNPRQLAINIRKPAWIKEGGYKIWVNDNEQELVENDNSYITLNRTWQPGDRIEVALPMDTQLEYLPDGSDWVSFIHGPVVLAAISDSSRITGMWGDDSRFGHIADGMEYAMDDKSFSLIDADTSKVTHIDHAPMHFSISEMLHPQSQNEFILRPFYEIHEARYIIYWPVKELQITSINNSSVTMKNDIEVYPNPFHDVVTFKYDVPANSQVIIDICSVDGQRVKSLVNTRKEAGTYTFEWNTQQLLVGIYYYQMQINEKVFTGRLIKTK